MKNIKKLLCAILTAVLLVGTISSYAAETDKITDICVLTGRLYYCDWETGKVVLKSVEPISKNDVSQSIARAMEYVEVSLVRDAVYLSDGTKADYDWLNNYADDKVLFIAAKQGNGTVSILHFKFE